VWILKMWHYGPSSLTSHSRQNWKLNTMKHKYPKCLFPLHLVHLGRQKKGILGITSVIKLFWVMVWVLVSGWGTEQTIKWTGSAWKQKTRDKAFKLKQETRHQNLDYDTERSNNWSSEFSTQSLLCWLTIDRHFLTRLICVNVSRLLELMNCPN